VRIPLDYYRILGLPPQCSTEQIQQAHRDRVLSMPRREYSDDAIASRRKILDQAYAVLSDTSQRQAYDAKVFPGLQDELEQSNLNGDIKPLRSELKPETPVAATGSGEISVQERAKEQKNVIAPPTIEIDDQDLAGVLLLLLELGSYEQVLHISQSYFRNTANRTANQTGNLTSSGLTNSRLSIDRSDRLDRLDRLSERAGEVSSSNPDIILTVAITYLDLGREHWKQGHYEIAAQSLEAGQELLLREGLFVNIRNEIQTDLFKLRPYRILELLAVSDFKASEHKQGLLLLQEMLEARKGIDGSGNDSSGLNIDDFLRFIQQLRGYMTSSEQQTLFEDEARRPSPVASYLAVYALIARGFSQRQPALVRRAKGLLVKLSSQQDVRLEQAVCALLLGQTEEASDAMEQSQEQDQIEFIRSHSEDSPDLLPGLCLYCETWLQEEVYPHFRDLANQTVSLRDYFADDQVQAYLEELPVSNGFAGSEWNIANISNRSFSRPFGDSSYAKPAPEPNTSTGLPTYTPERLSVSGRTSLLDRPKPDRQSSSNSGFEAGSEPKFNGGNGSSNAASVAKSKELKEPKFKEATREVKRLPSNPKPKRKVQPMRFLVVILVALAAVSGVFVLASWAWRSLVSPASSEPLIVLESPLIPPLLEQPGTVATTIAAQSGPIDQEGATKIVESWQAIKSKALGKEYEVAALDQILAEPVLSEWRSRAEELKTTSSYMQYISKPPEVTDFKAEGDDKASVVAKISETRNFFSNGNLDSDASKTDTSYDVKYMLIRKDNKWLIQDMIVSD